MSVSQGLMELMQLLLQLWPMPLLISADCSIGPGEDYIWGGTKFGGGAKYGGGLVNCIHPLLWQGPSVTVLSLA